ncbi:MAG TPA: hypothetical protein ENG03_09405 [Thioploca sp.]|nr:MAG: hypothetical protein DRR19_22115 [Gammaproteobacteria bacterium]HDN27292.1 hypothetical protein [Thioploca sp.]
MYEKTACATAQEYKANLVRKNGVRETAQEYKANLVRKNLVLAQEYKANLVRKNVIERSCKPIPAQKQAYKGWF